MNTQKIVIVFALMFLSLLIYNASAYTSTTGDLTGTVRSITGDPLDSVKVEVIGLDLYVYTYPNGTYLLKNIAGGEYLIKASRTGYYDVQLSVIIINNQTTTKNFNLATQINQDDILDKASGLLTTSWYSLVGAGVGVLVIVFLGIFVFQKISGKIFEGILVFIPWISSIVVYFTYGTGLNIHPISLILFPYTFDKILGVYAGVDIEVTNMCLVMLAICYVGLVQLSYALVRRREELQVWLTPAIAFIMLIGLGIGLQNFWNYAFSTFFLPLVVFMSFTLFAIVLMIFIKMKITMQSFLPLSH